MKTKKWYQSKIIWVNIFPLILSILELVNVEVLAVIGVENPMQVITILSLVTGMLTIVLRTFDTGKPIDNFTNKSDSNE